MREKSNLERCVARLGENGVSLIMKLLFALGVAVAVSLLSQFSAMAATCSVSTTSVRFSSYDVFSTIPLDTTGSVTFNCDAALSVSMVLNRGGSSTFNPRRMTKGSEPVNYNLYLDASKSTIWGDGTGNTSVYSNPSTPVNQNVTVTIFGSMPARQNASVGSYTDSISVTINF